VNKNELARRLAREMRRSRAEAADNVDALVHKLIMDLKKTGQKSDAEAAKIACRQKEPS